LHKPPKHVKEGVQECSVALKIILQIHCEILTRSKRAEAKNVNAVGLTWNMPSYERSATLRSNMVKGHSKNTVFESIILPVPSVFYETHKASSSRWCGFFFGKGFPGQMEHILKIPKEKTMRYPARVGLYFNLTEPSSQYLAFLYPF
jgi:hypothetical protein